MLKLKWVAVLLPFGLALTADHGRANVFQMPPGFTSAEMVTVGNPGNVADTRVMSTDGTSGYGAVPYTYSIGKFEITTGQYVQFLNAVATTDTYGLYNTNMSSFIYPCGIQRSGTSGPYSYSVATDCQNRPVTFVTFWNACRFANWLNNGQPTGLQNASTTEDGAYTLIGYAGGDGRTITKNAGATWWIPTENEWYKAAYYDPQKLGGAGYWAYPTKSDSVPSNAVVHPDPGNHANYDWINGMTEAATFENSASAYGTFDQGGNVYEWTETPVSGTSRGNRGGAWTDASRDMASDYRWYNSPTWCFDDIGFRVATVPEPGSIALLLAGAAAMMIWRRRRA